MQPAFVVVEPLAFHIREEGKAGRLGRRLIAVVAESTGGRLYLQADVVQFQTANVSFLDEFPDSVLPHNPRDFKTPNYGMETFASLFTDRQLVALTTFSELIPVVANEVQKDGGSHEYAKAVCLYLAFGISQLARYSCTICGWNKTNENVAQAFGRQAIPMVWDYAEANPFEGSLSITSTIEWPVSVIQTLGKRGFSEQADAQNQKIS